MVEVEVARMFSGVMVVVVVATVVEYSRDGRRVGGVVKNGVDGEVWRRVRLAMFICIVCFVWLSTARLYYGV